MNIPVDRQNYKDGTYEEAVAHGYDLVSLKYDGWWVRFVVENGQFQMFSRTQRLIKSGVTRPGFAGVFVGEYLFGTQWSNQPGRSEHLYLFDCWSLNHTNMAIASYRDRLMLLKTQVHYFPDWIHLVEQYPITTYERLWKEHVLGQDFEGVVFRRYLGSVEDPLIRQKSTITMEYRIVDFVEGKGKYEGSLGALVCVSLTDPTKPKALIGSGFTDKLRDQIWHNPEAWVGKIIECSGKALFPKTGLLRHPTYLQVREDFQS